MLPSQPALRSAFTLVEVAVAILVLAVGATASIAVLTYSLNMARSMMESLNCLPAGDMALCTPGAQGERIGTIEINRETTSQSYPTGTNGTTAVSQIKATLSSNGAIILERQRWEMP